MVLGAADAEEGRKITPEDFLLSRGSDEFPFLWVQPLALMLEAPGAAPLVTPLPLEVFGSVLDNAVAPTLHFSEVQADAEAVEGDLVGELEANPRVVAQ